MRYFFSTLIIIMSVSGCRSASRSSPDNVVRSEESSPEDEAAPLPSDKHTLFKESTKGLPNNIPEQRENPLTEREEIDLQLKSIAAQSDCSSDRSCVVLGLNRKACGLPTHYAVFSRDAPRYLEVEDLISRSLELEKEQAAGSTLSQVCGAKEAPTSRCIDGQCLMICQGVRCSSEFGN